MSGKQGAPGAAAEIEMLKSGVFHDGPGADAANATAGRFRVVVAGTDCWSADSGLWRDSQQLAVHFDCALSQHCKPPRQTNGQVVTLTVSSSERSF